ncbi:MAG: gliding motility-associated C-terminal domain-containing protein [Chitinophagales bacterium]
MLRFGLLFFLFTTGLSAYSQCVTTYPYSQDFELNNGNWTAGGSVSDWAWGTPTKAVISQAASGTKCWIVGGLSNSSYNLGESSFVQSPCFDFTNLQHPYISFNIFWESERGYDGTNLQYSTNGGTAWQNVGSSSDVSDCMTQNWFNTASINFLNGLATPKEGWSGNIQSTSGGCQGGSGSGGWVLAKHCLSGLGGNSNVIFRFTFGAGTSCNDFDGVAFDDVFIGEAPTPNVDYSFTCQGNNNVSFSATSDLCPDQLQWNFDDPNSGTNNTAGGLNVSHTFSAGGTYNVSFSAGGPCNPAGVVIKTIEVVAVQADVKDVSCAGATDGYAYVLPQAGGSPLAFNWSTTPTQFTDTAFNLAEGTYTVTVTPSTGCAGTATVIVNQAPPTPISITFGADTCDRGTGVLTANTSASGPNYLWSNGATTNTINNLTTGSYSVTVTDANSCSSSATAQVPYTSGISISFTQVTNVSCFETADGQIEVAVNGGQTPYTYQWSNQQGAASIGALAPGKYVVTVTDAGGCSTSDSTTLEKQQCPSYIYFPTGFSPNGDGANETFKPKYSIDLKSYQVRIYNRWGELIYTSEDVNEGWDGVYKGIPQALGVYVWVSDYSFMDGKKHTMAGNLTLLR